MPGVTATLTNGSTDIIINDEAHGASLGDYVVFADVPSPVESYFDSGTFAGEYIIASVANENAYVISGPEANADVALTAEFSALYPLPAGLNTSVLGPGWSSGTWSRSTWNSAVESLAGEGLRLWSVDNYGEDLVMNVRDQGIYYWDASSGVGSRAINLNTISGVSNPPSVATQVLVSEVDRHVICLGANPIFETQQDPLLIRWSSQENVSQWTPTATNTAGDLRLSQGSRIIVGKKTRRETLVFTDRALFSLQFIGPPYTFGASLLADNVRIAGPNAIASTNDTVFWMGFENFFVYDGRVQPIACSVRSYVFDNINRAQLEKITCGTIASENEIWWFYPSENSAENDRYVVFNYAEAVWFTGNLARTAWIDGSSSIRKYPQATDPNGFMYNHEFGTTIDTSNVDSLGVKTTSLNQLMPARLESSYLDIGQGDKLMFVQRIMPDFDFAASTAALPEVSVEASFVPYINGGDYDGAVLVTLSDYIYSDLAKLAAGITADLYLPQATYALKMFGNFTNANLLEHETGANLCLSSDADLAKTFYDLTLFFENSPPYSAYRKMVYLTDQLMSTQSIAGISLNGSYRNVALERSFLEVTPYSNTTQLRNRGRHMKLQMRAKTAGTSFRVGDNRIDIREDGRR